MSTPGYSGKPLVEKLGIKLGMTLCALDCPEDYRSIVTNLPGGVEFGNLPESDFVHLFVSQKARLVELLPELIQLKPGAILWISWPKKASKVPTDITEDTLRDVLLPTGLVDVKVCAVTEVWSGLKFLWRKS